jgi:hypothetical protein
VDESPEPILQSLRKPRKLPVRALKAANSNRGRLAPLLIQELQKFSADFQRYDPNDCLPVIAIYLLAEWEEGDAFETVLECFALDDGYGGYELGDLITEDGPAILAALCRGDLEALERFTERKDISGWARGAAFKAMVALVLWGKVPRENVVTRFAWIFRRKPFFAWLRTRRFALEMVIPTFLLFTFPAYLTCPYFFSRSAIFDLSPASTSEGL